MYIEGHKTGQDSAIRCPALLSRKAVNYSSLVCAQHHRALDARAMSYDSSPCPEFQQR